MENEPLQVTPSWGNDKWSDSDASSERTALAGSDAPTCSACVGCGMLPGTGPEDDVMNKPCWKCNPHAGCPRFVYELFMGQFWVMDNAEICKCVAMCVREDDAEAVAMALNIQADVQCHLIDENQRMQDEIRDIPRTGTGTLTHRHKLRGAMDFGIELSNWISRREIELSRQNDQGQASAGDNT